MSELSEWVDLYLDHLEEYDSSPNTIEAYGLTLVKWLEWCDDHITNRDSVRAFCDRPRRGGRPPAGSTKNRDLAALRSFYGWAIDEGMIAVDPAARLRGWRVPEHPPKAIPDDVWLRLWTSDLTTDERVWIGLGYYVGLRRTEINGLASTHFDTVKGTIHDFRRKGGAHRVVEYRAVTRIVTSRLPHLGVGAEAWLDELHAMVLRRAGDARLCAGATEGDAPAYWMNQELVAALRRAGMDTESFTPHGLRHSCATNLLTAGVPLERVADVLSHRNLDTTRGYLALAGGMTRLLETL